MARRSRSMRHRRQGRSSRRNRWLGFNWQTNLTLETTPAIGVEWVSFWAKWPASLANVNAVNVDPNEEFIQTNEPVDETLVRTIWDWNFLVQNPGTGGAVDAVVNLCIGLIPFDGGEFPSFYEFGNFSSASAVAPPNPIFQIDDPWILRTPFQSVIETEIFTTFPTPLFLESKAKRKLPAGMGILCVISAVNFTVDTSHIVSVNAGGDIRMLVKSGFSV